MIFRSPNLYIYIKVFDAKRIYIDIEDVSTIHFENNYMFL